MGHHVRQLAQLPGPQAGGGVRVQHGDLVVADLLHLGGEVAGVQGQKLAVRPRPQHHPAGEGADGNGGDQGQEHQEGHGTLLFHKAEVPLDPLPLEAGGEHSAHAVHRAQQKDEDVALLGVGVQGGQLQVEVHRAEHQRHRSVQKGAGKGVADGLAGLPGPGLRRGETAPLGAAGVEAAAEGAGVKVK